MYGRHLADSDGGSKTQYCVFNIDCVLLFKSNTYFIYFAPTLIAKWRVLWYVILVGDAMVYVDT